MCALISSFFPIFQYQCFEPASPYCIEGGGGNSVLMYSNERLSMKNGEIYIFWIFSQPSLNREGIQAPAYLQMVKGTISLILNNSTNHNHFK